MGTEGTRVSDARREPVSWFASGLTDAARELQPDPEAVAAVRI
jgi:hypothetical protein